MDVTELNEDQLSRLKWDYFYNVPNSYEFPHEIPDSIIFKHFEGISFVEEDF